MMRATTVSIGIILGILVAGEAWFLLSMGPTGAYLLLLLVLIMCSVLVSFCMARISDLKKTQASIFSELAAAKRQYLQAKDQQTHVWQALKALRDGIIILDKENRVYDLNAKAEALLGVAVNQVIGKPASVLARYKNGKPIALLLLESEHGTVEKEVPVSESLVLNVFINFLEPGHGGKIIVLQDVTKASIAKKNSAEFMSFTLHQLNSPLAAIKLSLEMFLDGSFGRVTKQQRAIIEKTYQRNRSLIYLVNDLSNADKIESGAYRSNWSMVDLVDLINSVVDANQETAKQKKITFTVHQPSIKLAPMKLDKEKIIFAVQNLLDNAIKYTPEGGTINLLLEIDGKKQVRITVQDSGIGIPESQQEKIFEKFFRATNARKTGAVGSGLGLFIAKNIVQAHDGTIGFTSQEGKGSTFYMNLPIRTMQPLPAVEDAARELNVSPV